MKTCRFFLFVVSLLSIPGSIFAQNRNPLAVKVRLTDGHTTVVRSRADLGFVLKSKKPVAFVVDAAVCKNGLKRIASCFAHPSVNAKPVRRGNTVTTVEGTSARSLNVATTATIIASEAARHPTKTIFRVAVDKKPPMMNAALLKGIDGVLSDFSTVTSGVAKRNHNVYVAANRINGVLLRPGVVFSLNETVGKRTQANGFLTAHVFDKGKVVDGIGGGVSQVTGTLFNAAALAGLKIIAVQPHSRPVPYLPLGRDATASDEGIDLKFANDTFAPVYIAYSMEGRHLRAILYGKKVAGRKIGLRTVVHKLAVGKIDVETYRVVRKNGKVTAKEKLLAHKYRWQDKPKP